jgi:hypothetical protein
MKSPFPIPFKPGDRVTDTGRRVGIVSRCREHIPVMIGVMWQDGMGFAWVKPETIRLA